MALNYVQNPANMNSLDFHKSGANPLSLGSWSLWWIHKGHAFWGNIQKRLIELQEQQVLVFFFFHLEILADCSPTKIRKWQTEGLGKTVNQSYSNLSGFRKHSVILLVEFTNLTALLNLISYLSEDKLILWRSKSNFQCFYLIMCQVWLANIITRRWEKGCKLPYSRSL